MKRLPIIMGGLTLTSLLSAATLVSGLNMVTYDSKVDLESSSYKNSITKVVKAASNGQGYQSYKPGDDFSDFTTTESKEGYIVLTNNPVTINDTDDTATITENCVSLVSGLNIVKLPALTLDSDLNGATITKIVRTASNGQGYQSYKPGDDFSDFTTTVAGTTYIVLTSSASTGTCDSSSAPTPDADGLTEDQIPPATKSY